MLWKTDSSQLSRSCSGKWLIFVKISIISLTLCETIIISDCAELEAEVKSYVRVWETLVFSDKSVADTGLIPCSLWRFADRLTMGKEQQAVPQLAEQYIDVIICFLMLIIFVNYISSLYYEIDSPLLLPKVLQLNLTHGCFPPCSVARVSGYSLARLHANIWLDVYGGVLWQVQPLKHSSKQRRGRECRWINMTSITFSFFGGFFITRVMIYTRPIFVLKGQDISLGGRGPLSPLPLALASLVEQYLFRQSNPVKMRL